MSPTHGTSSTSYVSILKTLQICTLHFMMNKVLVSIICLHFSPLRFNLHLWSPSSKLLHNELQYEIAITTPTTFLQISNVFAKRVSPNRRTLFSKSARYFADQQAAYGLFCALWRRPSLRSLPTCATGSTLYVMGGRLRFLGDTCSSYMCMGSALDVMDYGLAKAESSVKN